MRVWLCPRLDGRVTADTFYEIGVIKLSCHAALNQGDGKKEINQAAQAIDQGKTFGGINQAQAGE
jgi:hypothetical protein